MKVNLWVTVVTDSVRDRKLRLEIFKKCLRYDGRTKCNFARISSRKSWTRNNTTQASGSGCMDPNLKSQSSLKQLCIDPWISHWIQSWKLSKEMKKLTKTIFMKTFTSKEFTFESNDEKNQTCQKLNYLTAPVKRSQMTSDLKWPFRWMVLVVLAINFLSANSITSIGGQAQAKKCWISISRSWVCHLYLYISHCLFVDFWYEIHAKGNIFKNFYKRVISKNSKILEIQAN